MENANPGDSLDRPTPRRILPVLLIGLMGIAGLVAVWTSRRGDGRDSARQSPVTTPSGPVTSLADRAANPYKNTHPAVEYVGDAACARCHAEIAETYRKHPMGRSLSEVVAGSAVGSPSSTVVASFDVEPYRYTAEDKSGRVVHRESRLDDRGKTIVEAEAEVRYVVGSGTRGLAFLIDHDGRLTQSPISWYTHEKRWDVSPGYDVTQHHFEREIGDACLFCHANRANPVEHTNNRFQEPIFEGYAIGCERCHGPGGLHVKRRDIRDGRDTTIVNPAHLSPELRDAVCQQCHLKGDYRIVRAGRKTFDYRPGLPLHEYWSVFFRSEKLDDPEQLTGHVEQMQASRCYRESQGKLGCISCHDPHSRPSDEERVSYFRGKCLECHDTRGCSLPLATRREKSRDDNCLECHMPVRPSKAIAHTAVADHRIPRLANQGLKRPAPDARKEIHLEPYVHFHHDLLNEHERAAVERDKGIALSWNGWNARETDDAARIGREALARLEPAVKQAPDDVPALEAKAMAYHLLGRNQEALATFQDVLKKAPEREETLAFSALLASQTGMHREAVDDWRRALAINPWASSRQHALARELAADGRWAESAQACRSALALRPDDLETRKLLIRSYLGSGDKERARVELATLLKLDPTNRDALNRWFAEQQP